MNTIEKQFLNQENWVKQSIKLFVTTRSRKKINNPNFSNSCSKIESRAPNIAKHPKTMAVRQTVDIYFFNYLRAHREQNCSSWTRSLSSPSSHHPHQLHCLADLVTAAVAPHITGRFSLRRLTRSSYRCLSLFYHPTGETGVSQLLSACCRFFEVTRHRWLTMVLR